MLKVLTVSLQFGGKVLYIIYKLNQCLSTLKEYYRGNQKRSCYIRQFLPFREDIENAFKVYICISKIKQITNVGQKENLLASTFTVPLDNLCSDFLSRHVQ